MKELFKKYRPVVWFVLRFLGVYLVLSLGYSFYLNWFEGETLSPDPVTELVARQSTTLLTDAGYDAVVIPLNDYPGVLLEVDGYAIARIIEGCNAISVIVLFVAFILAFKQPWKKTLLFLFAGSTIIYAVNVLRIAVLTVLLYHYQEYASFLHGVLFPAIIYGMVFLLWMIWVRVMDKEKLSL